MKIGIITLYYNNFNYGGILQAYALTNYLNSLNEIEAEQIMYDAPYEKRTIRELLRNKKGKIIWFLLSKIWLIIKDSIFKSLKIGFYSIKDKKRIEMMKKFIEDIPHSELVLEENIENINDWYDVFITGSDQVWNPTWYRSACFLNFVRDEKKKISYAASMGVNSLSEEKQQKIIPLIKRLDFISVREKKAKNILEKYIIEKPIDVVVDPVLLLSTEEWNKIAHSVIKEKQYVYAYFLGKNKSNIRNAKKIAQNLGNNKMSIAYIYMTFRKSKKNLNNILIHDAGPAEFLGLIRDSEIVLTDSFHAVVFSIIFRKKFIAFKKHNDRNEDSMNSRIIDLLTELGLNERIFTSGRQLTKEFLEKEINYDHVYAVLEKHKKFSKDYLNKALML